MAGKSLAKDGKALKAVSQGNVKVKSAAVSNSTAANNSMAGKTGPFKMNLQMFASSKKTNPNALKYNRNNGTWTSNKGVIYGKGSKDGNRVKHVLKHTMPDNSKPLHTVFNVDKSEVIGLIDEAWVKRGKGVLQSNGNVLYNINMGKTVGTKGECIIRIITKGYSNNIITAFPK